jgi:hypothetical protein
MRFIRFSVMSLAALAAVACGNGAQTTEPEVAPEAAPAMPEMSANGLAPLPRAAFAMPIPAEKLAEWKAFGKELEAKSAEFDANRKAFGLTRQRVWLQQTPMGALAVIHEQWPTLEAMHGAMMKMMADGSKDEFMTWFFQRVGELHGVDMNVMLKSMKPSVLYAANGAADEAKPGVAFVVPIVEGKLDTWKAMTAEFIGPRRDEIVASRQAVGLSFEAAWLMETPMGPMVYVYHESDDLPGVMAKMAASESQVDKDFLAAVKDIHGFDVSQPMAPPQLALDWTADAGLKVFDLQ